MASAASGAYSRTGLDAATPEGHTRVQEGHAVVMMPPAMAKAKLTPEQEQILAATPGSDPTAVFYNKAQVVNRDLSVCVLETFAKMRAEESRRKGGVGEDGITVLEALSATGLRALRYWHEVEGIRHVIANDLDQDAVQCIRDNCKANGAPTATVADFNSCGWPGATKDNRLEVLEKQKAAIAAAPRGIVPTCDDAVTLMNNLALEPDRYAKRQVQWFDQSTGTTVTPPQKQLVDAVDLDPYGTAAPFLDSAVRCAREGALLLVTCTDSAILCGNYAETCHAKYASLSARLGSCHEMASRIVLATIERTANKHGKYIEPLISMHIDFYVRVFVRIRAQPAEVKLAVGKLAHVFHCVECPAFHVKPFGRVRPSKSHRKDELPVDNTGGLMPRKALRAERRAAAANVGARDDAETSTEPVDYPTSLPRATPMHCSSAAIEDVPRRCSICSGRIAVAGPIYAAPSQNPEFIDKVLETMNRKGKEKLQALARVQGLLMTARDELPTTPLFYKVPDLASIMKMQMPPNPIVIGALARLGYKCSMVHCESSGLKTNAPPNVIADVLVTYRQRVLKAKEDAGDEDAAHVAPLPDRIRGKVLPDLDLSYDAKYDLSSKATGVARFIQNPAFWGPRARHTGIAGGNDE